MHALITVAHPLSNSLSHSVAAHIAAAITADNTEHSCEIADLMAEGFDPRFTATDIVAFQQGTLPSADVVFEQARIDRANALVLVYPIYWWSMPALLKGWIDRVFCNGWAYHESLESPLIKKLSHLHVHLVAIGGAKLDTYQRYGYADAMKAQIETGIFNYCGAPIISSTLLLDAHMQDPNVQFEAARAIGDRVFLSA